MAHLKEQILNNHFPTPLWIISLFLSLVEIVLTVAVINTEGNIQVALTTFVIFFPLLIFISFISILWFKPHHFYSPTEFISTNVKEYVDAMTRTSSIDMEKVYLNIQEKLKQELTQGEIHHQIIKNISDNSTEQDISDLSDILEITVNKTFNKFKEENFLTLDSAPLLGFNATKRLILLDQYPTISDLLNTIWFSLNQAVPPFTYDKRWILKDKDTGKVFDNINIESETGQYQRDNRPVNAIGIKPGMYLEVHPL